jgi:serine O-acetyltransferase
MWLNIADDVDRYVLTSREKTNWLKVTLWNQGVWATIVYRHGVWINHIRPGIVRAPLRLVYSVLKKVIEIVTAIHLDSFAAIGPGLFIGHFGPIFVGGDLGAYCNLSPGVVIGLGGPRETEGRPAIGHRVYFAPGAKVFGAIKIGNDVSIGPNTVVNQDLPDNVIVLGIPARVVGKTGSYDSIDYRGKPPVNPVIAALEAARCAQEAAAQETGADASQEG